MNLLRLFRGRSSAPIARERLQLLLAHERASSSEPSDLVAVLKKEILAVLAKHVAVDPERVQVRMDRGGTVSVLEVDIEIRAPSGAELAAA